MIRSKDDNMKNKNEEQMPFGDYCKYYIEKYSKSNTVKEIPGVYEYMSFKICNASIRMLVTELHLKKKENVLRGDTSEERYMSFEKKLLNIEYLKELEEKYPVLEDQLKKIVLYTEKYVQEILDAFVEDIKELKCIFGEEICSIEKIEIGEGDTHNEGKSVAIVWTNACKLVYKPHSLDGDVLFEQVVNWVNKKGLKEELSFVKYYTCIKHGWQEFLEYEGSLLKNEVSGYYWKCGAYLFLFYLFGASDIHYENVIVNKKSPNFIDLETFVGISKNLNLSSVLDNAYLPRVMEKDQVVYDYDLSGLCSDGDVESQIKTIALVDLFTDNMRIENVNGGIGETYNTVWVDGEKVRIEEYAEDVINGFEDLWNLVSDNKEEFGNIVASVMKQKGKYRYIVRATQVYYKFLVALSHPDFLSSHNAREQLLSKLKRGGKDEVLSNDEIRQLSGNDVPYFYIEYDKRHLFNNEGDVVYEDVCEYSAMDGIKYRLFNLGCKELELQKSLIAKSLFSVYKKQNEEEQMERKDIIGYAKNYEEIVKKIESHVVSDADRSFLVMNSRGKDRYNLGMLNTDVADGGGIIWLLACYGAKTGKKNYIECAEQLFLEANVYKNFSKLSEESCISAFWGVGSRLYLSYNMMKITTNKKIERIFEESLNKLCVVIEKYKFSYEAPDEFSYFNGISGLLVMLCNMYEKTRKGKIQEICKKLENKVTKYVENGKCQKIGMMQGISGLVYALAVYDYVFDSKKHINICCEQLHKEDLMGGNSFSLSDGLAGMAFVRAYTYSVYNLNKIKKQFFYDVKGISLNIKSISRRNDLLCGRRGIKEILKDCLELLGNHEYQFDEIFNMPEYDTYGMKNNFELESFMYGCSGVAYSCMRDESRNLPSVVRLEMYM